MALTLPKTCSMGGSNTGLVGTIGVTLLNPDGTLHTARATAEIYEIGGGTYGKNISFPDNWIGSIKWDTGGGSPVYAVEEYNYYANNPDIDLIVNEIGGKWEIVGNQMVFYKADNVTEIMRFNLFDHDGNPSMINVFKRERI